MPARPLPSSTRRHGRLVAPGSDCGDPAWPSRRSTNKKSGAGHYLFGGIASDRWLRAALAALLVKPKAAGMEFDLEGAHSHRAYSLLASLVTPRPIAWVTSLNPDGSVNAAPFSFFNVLGTEPPIVGFSPGDRSDGAPKDTARNIRATHQFVVNLVDEAVAEAMNRTAASLPYGTSELESAGLSTTASSVVQPPRITEAPASLECTEWGTLQIGDNRLIIGLVIRVHVRDSLVDAETLRVRSENFRVIGRMASPHWYCRTNERFEMIRPD